MQLTRLRGACDPKPTCPTLYLTDRVTLIVQGWIVTTPLPSGPLPDGETEVEVPISLLWPTPSAMQPTGHALRLTNHDTAIVRGKVVDDADALAHLSLPDGETAIEVPIGLLPEVVHSAH